MLCSLNKQAKIEPFVRDRALSLVIGSQTEENESRIPKKIHIGARGVGTRISRNFFDNEDLGIFKMSPGN